MNMIITTPLEGIKPKDINNIMVKPDNTGNPCLSVELSNGDMINVPLTTTLNLFNFRSFLYSLHVIPEGCIDYSVWTGFKGYYQTVEYFNSLLQIRKLMEGISGKEYDQIGIMAYEVFSSISDRINKSGR